MLNHNITSATPDCKPLVGEGAAQDFLTTNCNSIVISIHKTYIAVLASDGGCFGLPLLPRSFEEFDAFCMLFLDRRAPSVFESKWPAIAADAAKLNLLAKGDMLERL
jgi:hypothetical protein